jgi:hypothetical protein
MMLQANADLEAHALVSARVVARGGRPTAEARA